MAEGSPPDNPWQRSRRERIGDAIRVAQEQQISQLGSELELRRTLEAGERRQRAAFRAVRNHLIPVFLAQMSKAGNPGFDTNAKAWPVAVSHRAGGRANIPEWIVALDKRGQLWQAGTFMPQEPYTDISAGRIGRVGRAEMESRGFQPVAIRCGDPDIYQFYLDEAFEKSIGWYVAKFPPFNWPI